MEGVQQLLASFMQLPESMHFTLISIAMFRSVIRGFAQTITLNLDEIKSGMREYREEKKKQKYW